MNERAKAILHFWFKETTHKERFKKNQFSFPETQTPWQELSREFTGQLSDGACLDLKEKYINIAETKGLPRDNH